MLKQPPSASTPLNEKPDLEDDEPKNPVIESAKFVYGKTNLVSLNSEGIDNAAKYVKQKLISEKYTPCTWRTHPLHLCPPERYSTTDPRTRATLDWIFLISALNFSFWSEREESDDRYGVLWREGWGKEKTTVWTGYWSLVAALDRALENGIPITDPAFYSSTTRCPDKVIESVFKAAPQCSEGIPLLKERISVMREVGFVLCHSFQGSFQHFIEEFQRRYDGQGSALQLVQMVTETFPSFRDEVWFEGRKVQFWKRAQILVAETWAAFYPPPPPPGFPLSEHPFFPAGVHQLTMFADYRVPQILHHLAILTYPASLLDQLTGLTHFAPGSREELSIRAASILAVEAVRDAIRAMSHGVGGPGEDVSSVLIDFYLWDLAKRVELGEQVIEGVETREMVPAHRTRSIWY